MHGYKLYDTPMYETALIITAALLLDHWLGEPRHYHPLVGFGWVANRVEQILFRDQMSSSRICGVVGWSAMLLPILFLGLLSMVVEGGMKVVIDVVVLYLLIGGRSLREHALAVEQALNGSLEKARTRVGWIVSRETDQLDEQGVSRAAVESVLENGNDALFGALFWYLVAGLPGVLIYRAANTLDAMWGYRNERYHAFGWMAAKMDDLLNWIPARLTAVGYAVAGVTRDALWCWYQQAAQCSSPNGGVVMSAGAGALQVVLGGAAIYHGKLEQKPLLGVGKEASQKDIVRAVRLLEQSLLWWLSVIWLLAAFGV